MAKKPAKNADPTPAIEEQAPPGLKVEHWAPSKLKPYKRNAKNHPPEQIRMIANLIKKHGFDVPIVIDVKGTIIKGHGRWLAAKELGMETVPVVVRADLTPTAAAEARIADNRVGEFGWDFDALVGDVVSNLKDGFDIELTGFTLKDLGLEVDPSGDVLQTGEPVQDAPVHVEIVEDEPPEPPKKAKSKLGQIWLLGEHRVACGDSTDPALVERVLATMEGAPSIMVTDPPYGVEYDPMERAKSRGPDGPKVHSTGKVLNDDRADWLDAYKLFTGDVAYVWHASLFAPTVYGNLVEAGFDIRAAIIWAKQQLVFGRGHYHWQHEPCWYGVRKGAQANWTGDRKQTTLWQIANKLASKGEDANTTHGTQKPVECMARPMLNHGAKGDVVYDPFLGSGTSVVAAEQTGRRCVGIELSPNYVDVIVERWQNLTGGKARLA